MSTSVPAAAQLGDHLAAGAAGEAGGEAPLATATARMRRGAGRHCRGDGVALGADGEPIGGVLDVAADGIRPRSSRTAAPTKNFE